MHKTCEDLLTKHFSNLLIFKDYFITSMHFKFKFMVLLNTAYSAIFMQWQLAHLQHYGPIHRLRLGYSNPISVS